jgi:hypothetical protein
MSILNINFYSKKLLCNVMKILLSFKYITQLLRFYQKTSINNLKNLNLIN